jgi:hypothetical protein
MRLVKLAPLVLLCAAALLFVYTWFREVTVLIRRSG